MKRIGYVMFALGVVGAACGTSGAPEGESSSAVSTSTDAGDASTSSQTTVAAMVQRTDIVSDQSGAEQRDANLVNAWGLAFNPAGPAWVAENGSGAVAVYDANGAPKIPAVTVPAPSGSSEASAPTGVVFNGTSTAFGGDTFLMASEGGTIAGWQSGASGATTRVTSSGAVYKGLAVASTLDGKRRLYASDFAGGKVDVYDETFARVTTKGGFVDPDIPSGYAPFNVQEVLGAIFVTYAKQDDAKKDDVKGAGNGYLDAFDVEGRLIVRLVSRGALNSPWGIATSPGGFGGLPYRLFVGNFGDGRINVYALHEVDGLARLVHEGVVGDTSGKPLTIDGLWALQFGSGNGGFGADQLYFTAGPADESHGVFGRLDIKSTSGGGTPGTDGGTTGTDGGTSGSDGGTSGSDAGTPTGSDGGTPGSDAGTSGGGGQTY